MLAITRPIFCQWNHPHNSRDDKCNGKVMILHAPIIPCTLAWQQWGKQCMKLVWFDSYHILIRIKHTIQSSPRNSILWIYRWSNVAKTSNHQCQKQRLCLLWDTINIGPGDLRSTQSPDGVCCNDLLWQKQLQGICANAMSPNSQLCLACRHSMYTKSIVQWYFTLFSNFFAPQSNFPLILQCQNSTCKKSALQ